MIETIEGTITLQDGRTVQFIIDPAYGWSQWGATTDTLGETVDVLDAMLAGLVNEGVLS